VNQRATHGVTVQSVDWLPACPVLRSHTFLTVYWNSCVSIDCRYFIFHILWISVLTFLCLTFFSLSFCVTVLLPYSNQIVLLCSVIMFGFFVVNCRSVPLGSAVLFFLPLAHTHLATDGTGFCSFSAWLLAYRVICVETRCYCCYCYCCRCYYCRCYCYCYCTQPHIE